MLYDVSMIDKGTLDSRVQSLLAEIDKAAKNLTSKQEKALQWAAQLQDIAAYIHASARIAPSAEDFEMETGVSMPPCFKSMFDLDQLHLLLSEMRRHRQALYNLRMQKSLIFPRNAANTL